MGTEKASLTKELKAYVQEIGIDVFGIANIDRINEKARIGKRPEDLFPSAKSIVIFGCGMADPFCRGWVKNGKGGEFFSLTLLELERRCWLLKQFFHSKGYHTFGGDIYGGGIFTTGIRLAEAASDCGMGYIGKSNLLITPKYGPRLNLLYLATDAELIPDEGNPVNQCGICTACQKACMSGAILGDAFFHARQCESIINVRHNKKYYNQNINQDCDRCLRVCPKGEMHWRDAK